MNGQKESLIMMGQLIEATRKQYNKSMIDVALKSGIDIRIIQAIEAGNYDCKLSSFCNIHEAIGFNLVMEIDRIITEKTMFKIRN
jgi:transcriptional regulator with XRE-family HTH domain